MAKKSRAKVTARDTGGRASTVNGGDSAVMPLAMVGALAGTAALTAYLTWPSRRSAAPAKSREALVDYLRDHLSGSDTATRVVHRLASAAESSNAILFRRLSNEFEEERAVVRTLLTQLGASERSVKRAAGLASGAVLSMTAGGAPGDLSLFRTLEGLAVGVQGKRCLWRTLQNLPALSTGRGMTFAELEAMAVRQWDAIEKHRRALMVRTFSASTSRPGEALA